MAVFGPMTKSLYNIWSFEASVGSHLFLAGVAPTFHLMALYPSNSQVKEMVLCAKQCSKRAGNFLTFGEFCVYASELKKNYINRFFTPSSKCSLKRSPATRISSSSSFEEEAKYEVFLGGSCNPTTWRVDQAIPYLKEHRISYYNPQVAHWKPELIELESRAKQSAEVMFYVIDNQTRSIASMIEAAHIAGTGRKLALVIHEVDGSMTVMGERISDLELKEVTQGHNYMKDLGERHMIPVFNTIPQALKWAAHLVHSELAQFPHVELGIKLVKVREVFDTLDATDSGWITLEDVVLGFRMLGNKKVFVEQLKLVVKQSTVDFDQFCCLYVEMRDGLFGGVFNKLGSYVSVLVNYTYPLLSWMLPLSSPPETFSYDIYLGGASQSAWRKEVAIPMLKTCGLTSLSPQEGEWSDHYLPIQASALESCRVLLFVIPEDARALAPMILASHYVGHESEVVLCIQYLPDDITIDGEKLSIQGVKDYNRGRVYLSDLATRSNVPVFEDLKAAVECAMFKCTQLKNKH